MTADDQRGPPDEADEADVDHDVDGRVVGATEAGLVEEHTLGRV